MKQLLSIIAASINLTPTLRNQEKQSFKEILYHKLCPSHNQFIHNLIDLYPQNDHSDIFLNLAKDYQNHSTCLISYYPEIIQLLTSFSTLTISHKHYLSQSLILALCLKQKKVGKIRLATTQQHLQQMGELLAPENQMDKMAFIMNQIQKHQLEFIDLLAWNEKMIEISKEDVLIIDIFNLDQFQYLPFLLKHKNELIQTKNLILYYSSFQNEEVTKINEQYIANNRPQGQILIEINPAHPLQTQQFKSQNQLQSKLIQFLSKDALHVNKQDVVIFYPVKHNLSRYLLQLKQLLALQNLQEQVTVISDQEQTANKNKNNIFIASSFQELLLMNYDLSHVLIVLDYAEQISFDYDYQLQCHVETIKIRSLLQKCKRMSLVGVDRIGCYYSLHKEVPEQKQSKFNLHSKFIIQMIDYGLSDLLSFSHDKCLNFLLEIRAIIKKQSKYSVSSPSIVINTKAGINPFFGCILNTLFEDTKITEREKKKITNLALMAFSIISHKGNLRIQKEQVKNNNIKPHQIWRKGGYLESCLSILTKAELIESRGSINSASMSFRKLSSKLSSRGKSLGLDTYEQREQLIKQFQLMELPDLIKQYSVNEELFNIVRNQVDQWREVLEIEKIPILLEKKHVQQLLLYFLKVCPKAVAVSFERNKKAYKSQNQQFKISKNSLLNYMKLGEAIFLMRLKNNEDEELEIEMSNNINENNYSFLSISPCQNTHKPQQNLQKANSSQNNPSKKQIIFKDIATSFFDYLLKEEGKLIKIFQDAYDCLITLDRNSNYIIIECFDNVQEVEIQFKQFIDETEELLLDSTRNVFYLGNVSFSLGAGGIAKDLVIQQVYSQCLVENIAAAASKQDLQLLFSKVKILDFNIIENKESPTKSVMIYLHKSKDYAVFYQEFHKFIFLGLPLEIKPVKNDEKEEKYNLNSNYIEFRWFVWKSHCQAMIVYEYEEEAKKAQQAFEVNSELDGSKISFYLSDERTLMLQNLHSHTDEIFLEQALSSYGKIESIQVLKTPLKEIAYEQRHLQFLIKQAVTEKKEFKIKMDHVQKGSNGLRKCKAYINNVQILNQVSKQLNEKTNMIGQGHLHAQTWFEASILIPFGSVALYDQILEDALAQFNEKPHVQINKRKDQNKTYLVIRSCLEEQLKFLTMNFTKALKGYPVEVPSEVAKVVLSDSGFLNFLDIEQKFECKLFINLEENALRVQCPAHRFPSIEAQIKFKLKGNFFYSLPLSKKDYYLLQQNSEKLVQMKKNKSLKTIELEQDIYALILEGPAQVIQETIASLSFQEEKKSEQNKHQTITKESCAICAEIAQQSIVLHCKHKFCFDCLQQYAKFSVRDVNLFPLKCPFYECKALMNVLDLQMLLDGNDWNKLMQTAKNKYLLERDDIIQCFTAGCQQLSKIKVMFVRFKMFYIKCSLCEQSYCTECKNHIHPGSKCEDQLFVKYMKDNGVRKCANPKCKVPVQRWTGCYKVHCTRCGINMCFKCEPESMAYFTNQNQCYRHLAVIHGGFF